MTVIETPMEQIYNKISSFMDDLCSRLISGTISPSDIPLPDLKKLIFDNFASSASYIDLNELFYDNIRFLLSSIQRSVSINNHILCAELLYTLSYTLKLFVYEEKNLQIEQANAQSAYRYFEFSHRQYDLHIKDSFTQDNTFTGRGVIYTAITGGYDSLIEPEYVDSQLDYICFTDNPDLHSNIWKIIKIDNSHGLDNTRLARRHKILCEDYVGNYDYSIWVDGKVKILGDLKNIIELYHHQSPLLCFPHFERDCIYDEAEACKNKEKESLQIIDHQISKYKKDKYPSHNGLVDTCVLFRVHHDPSLTKMLSLWWNEIERESKRDQLSFNYACYKAGFEYDLCNLNICCNPYFVTVEHNT